MGSVRAPENAVPGKAILRVELDSSTGKVAETTDFPVTVAAPEEAVD